MAFAVFLVPRLSVRFKTIYETWLPGRRANGYSTDPMGGLIERVRTASPGVAGTPAWAPLHE